jgi:hypothetical protein
LKNGSVDLAFDWFAGYKKMFEMSPMIWNLFIRYYLQKNEVSIANKYLDELIESNKLNPSSLYYFVDFYIKSNNKTKGFFLFLTFKSKLFFLIN